MLDRARWHVDAVHVTACAYLLGCAVMRVCVCVCIHKRVAVLARVCDRVGAKSCVCGGVRVRVRVLMCVVLCGCVCVCCVCGYL